ncbi:hypothetical protein ACFPA8_06300 [Streptomyces ovatisporus]|uniref:Secreted protein n=1 Tax=Streptomyces ovatisporus TaxID=1128682 RepID=A0ABV9A1B8_9ACTN
MSPRKILFTVTTAYLCLFGSVVGTSGVAAAAPNSVASAEYCPIYETLEEDAVVRENPDTNSVVRKEKRAGDLISFPCEGPVAVLDPESGVSFVPVECGCAADGEGWIRQDAFS